ncbi:hypothetical protein HAX54_039498 [Datura stramonium]|uniref:Uncharacterized protein n=1 Tax=Datura stramonium TaxID=4076 RepID=A0ABS8VM29_DATST|nr:hypothetical protein [Datura stramonium]
MASKSDKGMEVDIANKGLKMLPKGKKGSSSSAAKGAPARRFRAKTMEPHELKWFNEQKEAKYAPENWIDECRFTLKFSTICNKVHELVRKFYENWDTSFRESTKAVALVVILYGSSSVIG